MKIETKNLTNLLSKAVRVTGKPDNINVNVSKNYMVCSYMINGYRALIRSNVEDCHDTKFAIEFDLFASIIKRAKDFVKIDIAGNALSFRAGQLHGKNIAIMDTEVNLKFNVGEMLDIKVSQSLLYLLNYANLDNPDISTKDSLELCLHSEGKSQYAFCATNYYASLVTSRNLNLTAQFAASHARQISSAFNDLKFFFTKTEDTLKVGNEDIIFFMPLMQTSTDKITFPSIQKLLSSNVIYKFEHPIDEILNNIEVSRFVSEENQPYTFELQHDKIVCGFESNKGSVQSHIKIKKGPQKKIRFAVNAKHFVHILNKIKSFKAVTIKFTENHLSLSADDDNIVYFLMLLEEK